MTAGAKPAWPIVRNVATWLFFALAATLLVMHARKLDWNAIGGTVAAYSADILLNATLLAVLTYTIYSGYDVLGRSYGGVKAHVGTFMGIAFVSYACNQNLGALVGTVGLRLRLYSRLGMDLSSISRIIMLSVVTNWLGYIALTGALCWCISGCVHSLGIATCGCIARDLSFRPSG